MKATQLTIEQLDGWQRKFIDSLSEQRRRKILEFIEEMELAKRSPRTIRNYIWTIASLGRNGKPYEQLTKTDLIRWMHSLENNSHTSRTIRDLRAGTKRFLAWIHRNNGKKRDVLELLKIPILRRDLPKDILTRAEIQKLLGVCDNQRNRTLVFVLYESGGRLGEILGMRIRDISIDGYGAVISVKGKTGARRIRLIESVPDLQLWLSMHPDKNNPDAPLWPNLRYPDRRLGEDGAQYLLKCLAKRVGIKKRVYPHLLRHSRATHLASVLTEAQLREFFGWTKRSEMASIYVHLSGRDVDETLLKHYGRKQEEPRILSDNLMPKVCPRCSLENPPMARFCSQCSCALDSKVAIELLENTRRADELAAKVIEGFIKKSPELVMQILREHRDELQELTEKIESTPIVEST